MSEHVTNQIQESTSRPAPPPLPTAFGCRGRLLVLSGVAAITIGGLTYLALSNPFRDGKEHLLLSCLLVCLVILSCGSLLGLLFAVRQIIRAAFMPLEAAGRASQSRPRCDFFLDLTALGREIRRVVLAWKQSEKSLALVRGEIEQQIEARTRQLADANRELAEEVAEHRRSAAQMRLASLHRSAFAAMPVPALVCSFPEGEVIEVNESFLHWTGFLREEVIGKSDGEIDLWPDRSARESYWRIVDVGKAASGQERLFRNRAIHTRRSSISLHPMETQNGRALLITFQADARPATYRLPAAEAVSELEGAGPLPIDLARDFNNMLTVVQGHTELLRRDGRLHREAEAALEQVSGAAERAAQLTRQLVKVGRRQVLRPKATGFNELVSGMAPLVRHALGPQIEVTYTYATVSPIIAVDATLLEQGLMALAHHARAMMRPEGKLTIETSVAEITGDDTERQHEARPGRFACLRMADNGRGIEPAVLHQIFEPLFVTREVGRGAGLNLAAVYGVVKQHNGWIEVASQPGRGTEFKIFLPVCEDLTAVSDNESKSDTMNDAKQRIMVVEDEPSLRMLVQGILERYDYDVICARNGVEALHVWEAARGEIDLLLTDMVMPEGMTGRELARKLQANKPELKVVFTSGYSFDLLGDERHELVEGVNFIQKPYRPQTLTDTIRRSLSASETGFFKRSAA